MNRLTTVIVSVPLLIGGLTACGGGDSQSASTPAATAEATSLPTIEESPMQSAEPGSAVDQYCQQVDEYAAKMQELQASPNQQTATELQQKAQELQETAAALTQELTDDPSKATQVQECTTRLQESLGQ